jgi:hypothetical protein
LWGEVAVDAEPSLAQLTPAQVLGVTMAPFWRCSERAVIVPEPAVSLQATL